MKLLSVAVSIASASVCWVAADGVPAPQSMRDGLVFHAPFDGGTDASRAAGDPKLYWTPTFKQRDQAKPGLPESGEVLLAKGEGRFGDALRFTKRRSPVVFFQGAKNMPYRQANWSGTVSFWLKVDPQ